MTRTTATLDKWNDDQGFGFATPDSGGNAVFVHISAFAKGQRRPRTNDRVSFVIAKDTQGKIRGINASLDGRNIHKDWKTPLSLLLVFLALAFIIALGVMVLIKKLPVVVLYIYVVFSAITFAVYRLDKFAATNNHWRTRENTLQTFALLAGWPGALMAQHILRHKSRKFSFQLTFWFIVILNCAMCVWLFTKNGQLLIWFVDETLSNLIVNFFDFIRSEILY